MCLQWNGCGCFIVHAVWRLWIKTIILCQPVYSASNHQTASSLSSVPFFFLKFVHLKVSFWKEIFCNAFTISGFPCISEVVFYSIVFANIIDPKFVCVLYWHCFQNPEAGYCQAIRFSKQWVSHNNTNAEGISTTCASLTVTSAPIEMYKHPIKLQLFPTRLESQNSMIKLSKVVGVK